MPSAEITAQSADLARYSVTPTDIQSVQKEINNNKCDDRMVRQYIQATGGDLKAAAKRLQATLEWRAQVHPELMTCTACQQLPKSHYMHLVGYDLLSRPVMYSCLEMVTNRSIEDNRHHMISTFEQCIQAMPEGVGQWVWVSDFKGFGMSDCDPRLAKVFLDLSAAHYPERLGLFLVIDAPWIFNTLWRAIAPIVDPHTKKKIRFLPYDVSKKHPEGKTFRAALSQIFDPELTSWLLAELAENRDKHIGPHKFLDANAYFKRPAAQGHDIRGTSKILQLYAERPQLLRPFLNTN